VPPANSKCIGVFELSKPAQNGTATGAAIADKVQTVLAIVGGMHKAGFFRAAYDLQRFYLSDLLRQSSINQVATGFVKNQAHIPGPIASPNAYAARAISQRISVIPVEHLGNNLEWKYLDAGVDGLLNWDYPG
jgi:hypothetical protein